ncbi:MAG: TetR/AcrR family transcriptional regulator [Eubacteriales bacterium]|nr:TetR/AcrR family transcriptional regulator [Eubacteriales bacterium]
MGANMEQKKETKKKNLLCAAQELFLEKGVSKTSISEITERAQVAKGTFYLYFADKDDLLEQLLYQMSHDIIQRAFTYTEEHRKDTFADNVITFADWIICYFTEHTDVLRLIKRNFSWPMLERSLTDCTADPLWAAITQRLHDAPLPQIHNMQEQFNIIYLIIELCGTACYSSIIEHRPDTIENIKPLLYGMIRRILAV